MIVFKAETTGVVIEICVKQLGVEIGSTGKPLIYIYIYILISWCIINCSPTGALGVEREPSRQ